MIEDLRLSDLCCPKSDSAFAIYSKESGLISCHLSEREAINAFTKHARSLPETDALIYKKEDGLWKVL